MRTPRRPRVTYANVVATLALFFALGGTAAGAKVWVTGADIKDRSLTGADIADRSLSAKKLRLASISGLTVRDGSLLAADLDPAGLAAMVGRAGPAGTKGDQGPKATPETRESSDSPRRAPTSRTTSTARFSSAEPSRQMAAGSFGLGWT